MRTATNEATINTRAAHYLHYAADAAAIQQKTVTFVSSLIALVRILARYRDKGLTRTWAESHELNAQLQRHHHKIGRPSASSSVALRAELSGQSGLLVPPPWTNVPPLHRSPHPWKPR